MSDPGWVPYVAAAGLVVAAANSAVTLHDRRSKRRALAIEDWRPVLIALRDAAQRLERDPTRDEGDLDVLRGADDRIRELRQRTNDSKLLELTRNIGSEAGMARMQCSLARPMSDDPADRHVPEIQHAARTGARELRESVEAALARLAAVERARG